MLRLTSKDAQPTLQTDARYTRQPSYACKLIVKSKYVSGLCKFKPGYDISVNKELVQPAAAGRIGD